MTHSYQSSILVISFEKKIKKTQKYWKKTNNLLIEHY